MHARIGLHGVTIRIRIEGQRLLLQLIVDALSLHLGQLHIHAAQIVNDSGKAIEVDGDVLIDIHLEVLVHRGHGHLRAAPAVGIGDLIGVLLRRHRYQQVALNRSQLDGAVIGIDGADHHCVAAAQVVHVLPCVDAQQQDIEHVRGQIRIDFQLRIINGYAALGTIEGFQRGLFLLGQLVGIRVHRLVQRHVLGLIRFLVHLIKQLVAADLRVLLGERADGAEQHGQRQQRGQHLLHTLTQSSSSFNDNG